MQTLISNKKSILEIKEKVENLDSSLFIHYNYPNIPIYDDTISIVMTSSNRSKQVYFTLKTIEKCSFKNIHVIIVDDSDVDPINKEYINKYLFHIDLIYIRNENKNWVNPIVNYNIGFKFIKGNKVIIQNAEVCYIGDIIGWVSNNIIDNNYYSFDVKAVSSYENNEIIYNTENLTTDIYDKNIYQPCNDGWYHGFKNITNYHFLIAITRNTFEIIKNFSYDYTLGKDWDDNDFLLKVKSKEIKIINIFHNEYKLGGIHLYHTQSYFKWTNSENNLNIFNKKLFIFKLNNKYIDFIENINLDYLECKKFYINNETNLFEIQNELLNLNYMNIQLIFDKKKYTKEMNSFRKCILKNHFYKNSNIKIPKNLNIKIIYQN